MSGRFDPYHKWLGIPAHEQPANYYRLLGLELFEQDLDAIEAAADRLINYVRHTATGEQREQAQVILDELSAARRCLLITDQKRAYDAGLRAGRSVAWPARRTQPEPRGESPVAVQVVPVDSQPRVPAQRPPKYSPSRRSVWGVACVIAAASMLTLGWILLRGDSPPVPQIAEVSEVPKRTDVSHPADVTSHSSSTRPTIAQTGSTSPEPAVDPQRPQASVPVVPSPRPPFANGFQRPDEQGELQVKSSEPITLESPTHPPTVESPIAAPPTAEESAAAHGHAIERQVAATAERGALLREVWNDVTGNNVEEFLRYIAEHPDPTRTETIDRFEPPEDFDDQYGQRLRGYLHPPLAGSYTFSVRANAEGWLYISTDARPENKRRVEPETKIEFEAGQLYYVEAYHKESTGRDYLSVGWTLPDGSEEAPIPGLRLSVHDRIVPLHESEFVPLTPRSAESSLGTTFELLDAGVIATTGASHSHETYQLAFDTEIETITALRLEAIPDDGLPAKGPGRGLGGRFTVEEFIVNVSDRSAPGSAKPLRFSSAADEAGNDLRRIVDGDGKTIWRAAGRGEPCGVTLIVGDPIPFDGGTSVNVEIHQREALGRFRLLATSAPDPRSVDGSSVRSLYSLLVNLGGDDFTAPDGTRWQASKFFDNETFGHEGGRGVVEELIANKVQGTAQRGITSFRAIVPQGSYDVTLYFCEYWSTTPGSRRFAIAAEQRIVAANLDLWQAAGGIARPLVYPIRNIAVQDGRLDIDFRETSSGASTILNAIRIQQVR